VAEKYFLTPQTANLMEDLYREITSGSSLFLLYGIEGIGKSRLVTQLLLSRQFRMPAIRLDFSLSNNDTNLEGEKSAIPDAAAINQTFENCSNAGFIVIDHLEEAGQKARHQIFQSWMTDGIDKSLNVLLISSSDSLSDFKLLSNQYKSSIQSFQLLPFNKMEVMPYITHRLYPDLPGADLDLSVPARKALKKVDVRPLELNLFGENYKSQIKLQPQKRVPGNRQFKTIIVMALALSLSGIGSWVLIERSGQILPDDFFTFSKPTVLKDFVPPERELKKQSGDAPVIESARQNLDQENVSAVLSSENAKSSKEELDDEIEVAVDKTSINGIATNISQSKLSIDDDSLTVASNNGAEQSLSSVKVQLDDKLDVSSWFKQDLLNSLGWINSSNHKSSTIQIMSIGFARFDDDAYSAYLDDLVSKGIDRSKIQVFQTHANGDSVFSVIYGQYENQKAANQAISELPQSLKANQPIPRTIGGVWREIQQNKN
jgi:hypothetical protein